MTNFDKLILTHLIKDMEQTRRSFCISCKDQNIPSIVMYGLNYMSYHDKMINILKEANNEIKEAIG